MYLKLQQGKKLSVNSKVLPVLQITTASMPGATQFQPYSLQLTATGGATPYRWSATGLPTGITCSSSGLISGTPSVNGSFTANISVFDADFNHAIGL